MEYHCNHKSIKSNIHSNSHNNNYTHNHPYTNHNSAHKREETRQKEKFPVHSSLLINDRLINLFALCLFFVHDFEPLDYKLLYHYRYYH